MEIKQEVLDIAFLETIFKKEFTCFDERYYQVGPVSRRLYRFTPEQVEAERVTRKTYLNNNG
jgi:hypothetical protein